MATQLTWAVFVIAAWCTGQIHPYTHRPTRSRLTVGLNNLKGLFQPKRFCDFVILPARTQPHEISNLTVGTTVSGLTSGKFICLINIAARQSTWKAYGNWTFPWNLCPSKHGYRVHFFSARWLLTPSDLLLVRFLQKTFWLVGHIYTLYL